MSAGETDELIKVVEMRRRDGSSGWVVGMRHRNGFTEMGPSGWVVGMGRQDASSCWVVGMRRRMCPPRWVHRDGSTEMGPRGLC